MVWAVLTMTSERATTEAAVDAVAAAVWDRAKPVKAGVRPAWAVAVHDPAWRAGVRAARQDARTAFDASLRFMDGAENVEFRRENGGPSQGWRPVKHWESVDVLLEQGFAVQQRIVTPWMYVDDGTDGKGFGDARIAFR